jgi:hypothetical protein
MSGHNVGERKTTKKDWEVGKKRTVLSVKQSVMSLSEFVVASPRSLSFKKVEAAGCGHDLTRKNCSRLQIDISWGFDMCP